MGRDRDYMPTVDGRHIILGLLSAGLIAVTSTGCSQREPSPAERALQCAQLYELKKQKYWGDELGNHKYTFNSRLNTCLALNIYNDAQRGRYYALVIDMSTDRTLLHYSDTQKGLIRVGDAVTSCSNWASVFTYTEGGKETTESSCDRNIELNDKMLAQVKELGFEIH